MLFAFVVLAEHFAVGVHFDANFLAILLNDGFKVGALFLPADDCSAFGFCLGSLLHSGRDVRTVDGLFFVFFFLRLRGHAECEAGADHCYCE